MCCRIISSKKRIWKQQRRIEANKLGLVCLAVVNQKDWRTEKYCRKNVQYWPCRNREGHWWRNWCVYFESSRTDNPSLLLHLRFSARGSPVEEDKTVVEFFHPWFALRSLPLWVLVSQIWRFYVLWRFFYSFGRYTGKLCHDAIFERSCMPNHAWGRNGQ